METNLKPRAMYFVERQWGGAHWRVESRQMTGDRFGSAVVGWGETLAEALAHLERLEAMRLIEQTGARP